MQKNDIYDVEIIDNGMNGEGVARIDGKIAFVPYTLKGEMVRVRIADVRKDFIKARCIKIIEPSNDRVTPECPYFFKCGGCDAMHITDDAEKRLKIAEFKKNMLKIGGISIDEVDFIESDLKFQYRNKVQFPFGLKDGQIIVGYYETNTHNVVPIDKCLLNGSWATNIVNDFLAFANAERLSVYDENTGKGLLRHLVLRNINGKKSAVIVINGEKIPNIDKFKTDKCVDLFYNVNRKKTNVILGDKFIKIRGNDYIETEIMNIKAQIYPDAFMQINDNVRDKLYSAAISKLDDCDAVIDLYSGIGITTNLLAEKHDDVYSIEIVKSAVENAVNMARLNGNADKIKMICGDAAIELPKLIASINKNDENKKHSQKYGVLLDPPRKGCDTNVIKSIAAVLPEKIVYISCNHATLARDVKILQTLTDNAYDIERPALFDMFPNTHHVESLITLNKLRLTPIM